MFNSPPLKKERAAMQLKGLDHHPSAANKSDPLPYRFRLSAERQTASFYVLAVILLVGALFRVLGAYWFHGIIDTEGAEYARIAENILAGTGYIGISTPGTQLFFPPLFPLLIAAGSLVTGNIESGGLLVSVVAGTSLIGSGYLLARDLYGRRVGHIAAALIAFHPLLVGWSITLYGEITYLSLMAPGLYFGLRAIRQGRMRLFGIAGGFFGAAYLVRPEAIFYPFLVVGAALIHALLTDRTKAWRSLVRAFCAVAAFLPLALPYIIWLSLNTGEVRIEGKSPLNVATGQRMLSGMSSYQASFEVDDRLVERGIWLQPSRAVIQSARTHPVPLAPYLAAKFIPTVTEIVRFIGAGLPLGAPVLSILAGFGLIRTRWRRRVTPGHFVLLGVVGISLATLPLIYYVSVRFFLVFLLIALLWAAKGIYDLARLIAFALSAHFPSRRIFVKLLRYGITGSGMAGLLLVSALGVRSLGELRNFDSSSWPVKTAGEWIRHQSPSRVTVADTWTPLAFHAHARFTWLPYASLATALRYLEDHHIDFIVVSDRARNVIPYLKSWAQNGIPDARAHLVYRFYAPALGNTAIYRWVAEHPR